MCIESEFCLMGSKEQMLQKQVQTELSVHLLYDLSKTIYGLSR